jgi:hypothetical protein
MPRQSKTIEKKKRDRNGIRVGDEVEHKQLNHTEMLTQKDIQNTQINL